MDKIRTGSRFQTSVSACVKASNLLLIGNVKITFVSSTVFNVSCIDGALSNCISVLKTGMSYGGLSTSFFLITCEYYRTLVF